MELTMMLVVYAMTFLIPINGLILLAMRRERRAMRAAFKGLWRIYGRR